LHDEDAVEDRRLVAQVAEARRGRTRQEVVERRIEVVNDNEPLRIPIRKRPQEHCVDYTEDRAVRSNSEREREQDDQ